MSELSAGAINLLLELLEQLEPILSGAAAELEPTLKDQLIGSEFLVHYDFEHVTTSIADHDDTPVSLTWSEQRGSLTYFGGTAGQFAVDQERLRRWQVAVDTVLKVATVDFDLQARDTPFNLIDGILWEIGDARLNMRRPRTPIWFARRLWDISVQEQVRDLARARPSSRLRVILTSSRAARIRDFSVPGATLVSLTDALKRPNQLVVDPDILGSRLGTAPEPDVAGPISLSPDGKTLRINGGPPIPFRSEPQVAAIRSLADAYRTGVGVPASELTVHGSLRRLFGASKWEMLSPYLKSVNGLWSFKP